ncbi:MAG: zinc ribbon domain-containing protein [Christensenellaceae bacterium]
MPFFDYKCPECGKKFSELVKDYKTPVFCPDCNTPVERDYNGNVSGSFGKTSKRCSGKCSECKGCG